MTHHRWLIIILAFFALIITYLDRVALSYAITPIETTFGLNNNDFGIIAAAFGIGYLFMTIGGGVLVDRYGARYVWSLSAILWSIACASIGLATGFWWIACFRLLLGITEGPSFPALTRVVADWLPRSERARALALGLVAVPFASVIGAPLLSHLVVTFGWRLMFITLGIAGIIWGIIWYLVFCDHPHATSRVSAAELAYIESDLISAHPSKLPQKTTWKFMLLNRALLVNNYAFFSFGYLLFFAITWLPGYLEQTYHLKLREVGWFLILPWITATIMLLIGGLLSDWLWNKTHNMRLARSHVIWICQVLSAISFIPVMFHPSLTVALISISLGIGFGLMPNAVFYAINADLAKDRVATSLGIMDCALAVAGIIAPYLTGLVTTITGNFSVAFVLMSILTLSSAISIIIWQTFDDLHSDSNNKLKPVAY